MKNLFRTNDTAGGIVHNMMIAFISLFVNGFGVYLTIHANIGSAPWDVLNLGLSKTFGILYGTASISVSLLVLAVDVVMREPIGLSMLIDSFTVGKTVDFFNYIDIVPTPKTLVGSIIMTFCGIIILAYTEYFYMSAALGCGPRDTLIVGLTKLAKRFPIGFVTVVIQGFVTLTGYLLGGKVGVGTLICAFCTGPIMQLVFHSLRFDATEITHQNLIDSARIFVKRRE